MVKRAEELFKMADVNGDGTLSCEEFLALMETAKRKYPQVQVQLTYVENDCKRYVLKDYMCHCFDDVIKYMIASYIPSANDFIFLPTTLSFSQFLWTYLQYRHCSNG